MRYGDEHDGDCNVPWSVLCHSENGLEVKLRSWLNHQRQFYKKDTLRADKRARLQELVDGSQLNWLSECRLECSPSPKRKSTVNRVTPMSRHVSTDGESEAVDVEESQRSKRRYVTRPPFTPVPPTNSPL